MLSIVFPAYNEEGNVAELHRRILVALRDLPGPFEIIAVENASTDRTYEELRALRPIKIIRFAYNIGQTAALDAGIHAATYPIVVTMDADLQNDPMDIPRMFTRLQAGDCDAVVGWRKDRHDDFGRKLFSWVANTLTRRVLGFPQNDYACALKMFKKSFLGDLRLYGEMHVFLGAILAMRGARVVEMEVKHHERTQGLSKHTFIKGAKDLADLFTIKFLLSTSRPLLFFGAVGLACLGLGFLAAVAAIVLKFLAIRNLAQTPLPVVSSLFVMMGVMLGMMGLLAELLVRVYYESKRETPYLIAEVTENE